MTQIGTVISVSGDFAQVMVRRASSCGENCAMCKGGCAPTNHIATVKNTIAAKAGDMVKIETDDSAILKSVCLVYLLPLLILFVFYGLGMWLTNSNVIAAICGILGLAAGFFILRKVDEKSAPVPEIVAKL